MRRVFSFLILLLLVLGMAGNALAVDTDWTNAGADRRWDNPLNWSTGDVPTADDKASIRNDGVGPIIDSITTAVTDNIPVGDWGFTNTLDITGGSLTTNGWFIVGYGDGDVGTFTVSGGTTTVFGGSTDLTIGRAGVGHLNISAGSITVGDKLYVGREASGTGYITMTGGLITIIDDLYAESGTTYINVSGGVIDIGERIFLGNGDGGEAHLTMTGGSITLGQLMAIGRAGASGELHLDGGTLDIGYWLEMPGNGGSIDITGGTLIIDGDRISDGVERSIMPYIDDDRITAYGGSGTLNVDYNTTNPGKTTLTAVFDPTQAFDPDPEHEETGVCRTVVLSWTPPEYAPEHKLYFSTDFNDVNDSNDTVLLDTLTDPEYDTTGLDLEYNTTYYWKVNEANGAGWDEGFLWQFTTELLAYPLANGLITATADSSDADQGPQKTINLSGDLHSTELSTMWLSASGASQPNWIQYEFDKVRKLHQMWVWNYNGASILIGFGIRQAKIEYSTDDITYQTLGGGGNTYEFAQATGASNYAHDDYSSSPSGNNQIEFGGVAAKYVRITANTNWGGAMYVQYGLSEVRFFNTPMRAEKLYPKNNASNVPIDAVLSWKQPRDADKHYLYLSASLEGVSAGTIAPHIIDAAAGCETGYGPLSLELGKTYYWKVNEVSLTDDPNTWEDDDVWSFSTPEYVLVEDFEGYSDDTDDEVFATWPDGFNVPTNGSQIGYFPFPPDNPHYLEQTIVHGGSWSAPLHYDNTGTVVNSEVTRTFSSPQDWTVGGIRALTLFFYGQADNTTPSAGEQMYVKLNGAKVVYDGDPNDITEPSWHEWNIDLALFAINLQNVTTISIGFNRGADPASGVVYFDDIRLYPSRCALSKRSADFALVDFAPAGDPGGDCVVNYKDLDVMFGDWLDSDSTIQATPPGDANLVAWYEFTGDFTDSSANAIHGTPYGGPYTENDADLGSDVAVFDGTDDYLDCANPPELDFATASWTVAAWIKASSTTDKHVIYCKGGDGTGGIRYMLTLGESNDHKMTLTTDADTGGGKKQSHGDLTVDDGEWHHVLGMRDGDILRVYVDGTQDGRTTDVGAGYDLSGTSQANAYIGANWHLPNSALQKFFRGSIDDVRVYSKALSHGEILSIMGLTELYLELTSPANVYKEGKNNEKVNFKDYALVAERWLHDDFFP